MANFNIVNDFLLTTELVLYWSRPLLRLDPDPDPDIDLSDPDPIT